MAAKIVTTKSFRIEGQLDYQALAEMARRLAASELGRDIPETASLTLNVYVPGGGDWSNMDLDVEAHPVQFTVEWTEASEDGR